MQLLTINYVFITGVFLVLTLLLVASIQGLRYPERCSIATWSLFIGVAAGETSILGALKAESDFSLSILFAVVAIVFLFLAALGKDSSIRNLENLGTSRDSFGCLLGVIVSAIGIYLFLSLSSYSETLLTWESQVSRGFAEILNSGQSLLDLLGQRLLWDEGLVSSGERSFLYGMGTRVLLEFVPFSTWSLRATSLLIGLLTVPMFFATIKRFFGRDVAMTASLLLFLNPLVIYYWRYGTSLSATIFSLVLSLYYTWLFVSERKPGWWVGILIAFSFYLATLHYSPARLWILVSIFFVLISVIFRKRDWNFTKLRSLLVMLIVLSGICFIQYKTGHVRSFLNARGEQIFNLFETPSWVKDQIGINKAYSELSSADKTLLVKKSLKTTISQTFEVLSPIRGIKLDWKGISNFGDPPESPLYFGPILPFFIWGFLLALFKLRSPKTYLLILIMCAVGGVLLLTNRVDLHRAFILVLPFSIFSALGIQDFRQSLACLWGNTTFLRIVAVLGICCLVLFTKQMVKSDEESKLPSSIRSLHALVDKEALPVKVIVATDHRYRSWLNMMLVEKNRRYEVSGNEVFDNSWTDKISDEGFSKTLAEQRFYDLKTKLRGYKFFFAPSKAFQNFKKLMEQHNCVMTSKKYDGLEALILENCP